MNKQIFVDTGAFLALANAADSHHLAAKNCLYKLCATRALLVSTNFVLDETYTRIQRKAGAKIAIQFGENLQSSRQIKIITIDRSLEKKAWEIFKKYHDHAFSFTDCTSFAVMRQHKISKAFAFDKDFVRFGFELVPSS